MAWRSDFVESEESYMDNEEEEGQLATAKTQLFVREVYTRAGLSREGTIAGIARPSDPSKRMEVLWNDTLCQLRSQQSASATSPSRGVLACWKTGDLRHFPPSQGVLSQCEQLQTRRASAIDCAVRVLWTTLAKKAKVRPASASVTHMKSLLINGQRYEKANISKPTISPKTRRTNIRFFDPIYPVFTPTVLKQKSSQPSFSTPIATYQDFAMAARGFPAMERSKSSRKYLQRVKATKSPVPQKALFPQIAARPTVLSEGRLDGEWDVRMQSYLSSGGQSRVQSKPRKTAKRGGKLRIPNRSRVLQ